MPPMMYSHRLKTVLQHSVRELGLTVSMSDEHTDLSLTEHEAMIRETAQLMGIRIHFETTEKATFVTFYR